MNASRSTVAARVAANRSRFPQMRPLTAKAVPSPTTAQGPRRSHPKLSAKALAQRTGLRIRNRALLALASHLLGDSLDNGALREHLERLSLKLDSIGGRVYLVNERGERLLLNELFVFFRKRVELAWLVHDVASDLEDAEQDGDPCAWESVLVVPCAEHWGKAASAMSLTS